jgi:hypothetical protein
MMSRHALCLAFLLPGLAGCLKTTERLLIAPDGSVRATVTAEGDLADLREGYPVPFHSGFAPAGTDSARWLAEAGGAAEPGKVDPTRPPEPWRDERGEPRERIELRVAGAFPSVDAMPGVYAPPSDPYGTAHLQRETRLDIAKRDGRTIYVFERVFRRRSATMHQLWESLRKSHEGLSETLRRRETPAEAEIAAAVASFRSTLHASCAWLAREAVAAIYTHGGAALSLADHASILEGTARGTGALIDGAMPEDAIRELVRIAVAGPTAPPGAPRPRLLLEELEIRLRDTLRLALAEALGRTQMEGPMRHGVLARLEWLITAEDATTDLGDERFVLEVALPGRVVSGNFQRQDGSLVTWEFEGKDMLDRDVVLRAVSVLE